LKKKLYIQLVTYLEFNVPFQHKYGYIRDELCIEINYQKEENVCHLTDVIDVAAAEA